MLTLSFIHNFAPKKFKPKTMDRKTKAFTGKLFISFQDPIFKQRGTPHRKPFSTKKLYKQGHPTTIFGKYVFGRRFAI